MSSITVLHELLLSILPLHMKSIFTFLLSLFTIFIGDFFCLFLYYFLERLLKGAEDLELKKLIKANFGGGVKEFIFEEQEFYQEIENEETFLNSQERQQIIYDILNKLTVGNDSEEDLVLEGRKVPNGRKLSESLTLILNLKFICNKNN